MASPLVTFRAVPPLDQQLAARSSEGKLGAPAADACARYFALLAAELRALTLTCGEAGAICDVLNSVMLDDIWFTQAPVLLAAELEDAAPDGLAAKWDIDLEALAATVRSWTRAQALAVIDAAERWWRLPHKQEMDASLADVGLIRAQHTTAQADRQ